VGYYQGDMYRGDFFGSIGKIFSTVRRVASPVFSALGGVMSHPSAAATGAIAGVAHAGGAIIRKGASEVAAHPVLAAAGAATAAAGAGTMLASRGVKGPKMRVGAGGVVTFHRRRRMHATNTKALRRALRRAYAFERIAMRTIHLLHPRKKGRFGGFRRHRRRAA
jgi:hypothetical protein